MSKDKHFKNVFCGIQTWTQKPGLASILLSFRIRENRIFLMMGSSFGMVLFYRGKQNGRQHLIYNLYTGYCYIVYILYRMYGCKLCKPPIESDGINIFVMNTYDKQNLFQLACSLFIWIWVGLRKDCFNNLPHYLDLFLGLVLGKTVFIIIGIASATVKPYQSQQQKIFVNIISICTVLKIYCDL